MISWHEALLRLVVALLFSGIIGAERFFAGKAAGVRTHILVGVGAGMFTIISGYAFGATASNADRIAAQVVTGIGFIGGGAILREGTSVKGLTTAAALWAVAALGMAAGAGMFAVGALGTGIILLTLVALNRAESRLPRRLLETWEIQVTLPHGTPIEGVQDAVKSACSKVSLESLIFDEVTHITFEAEASHGLDIVTLTERIRAAGATKVVWLAREKGDRGA